MVVGPTRNLLYLKREDDVRYKLSSSAQDWDPCTCHEVLHEVLHVEASRICVWGDFGEPDWVRTGFALTVQRCTSRPSPAFLLPDASLDSTELTPTPLKIQTPRWRWPSAPMPTPTTTVTLYHWDGPHSTLHLCTLAQSRARPRFQRKSRPLGYHHQACSAEQPYFPLVLDSTRYQTLDDSTSCRRQLPHFLQLLHPE